MEGISEDKTGIKSQCLLHLHLAGQALPIGRKKAGSGLCG